MFGNGSKRRANAPKAIPYFSSKLACSSRIASLPPPLPPLAPSYDHAERRRRCAKLPMPPPSSPVPHLYLSIVQFLALTRSACVCQSASQPQHPVRPHCTARQALMHAHHIRLLLFRYYATGAIVVSLAAGTYSSKFHPPYPAPHPHPAPLSHIPARDAVFTCGPSSQHASGLGQVRACLQWFLCSASRFVFTCVLYAHFSVAPSPPQPSAT
jgi:hypothetical protein